MPALKTLTKLWFDTPRWVRGFFLGNLCYIVYAVLTFNPLTYTVGVEICCPFLLPMRLPVLDSPIDSQMYSYHLLWCLLAAVLVQLFGEKRGIIILLGGLYVIGIVMALYSLKQVLY